MKKALIDGDVLHHASLWRTTTVEEYQDRVQHFLSLWLEDVETSDFQVALGGPTSFRKEAYPNYKDIPSRVAGRANPLDHAAESRLWLAQQGYTFVDDQGLEADDWLAIWATADTNSVVVTVDKDLLQVPGWHYSTYYNMLRYVSPAESFKNLQRQLMMGDGMDRIAGVPGIGKKRAELALAKGLDPYDLYSHYYGEADALGQFLFNGSLLFLLRFPGDRFSKERYDQIKSDSLRPLEVPTSEL